MFATGSAAPFGTDPVIMTLALGNPSVFCQFCQFSEYRAILGSRGPVPCTRLSDTPFSPHLTCHSNLCTGRTVVLK